MAIDCVNAYHTISYNAVTVVAYMAPIDLMALERCKAFKARRAAGLTVTDDEGGLPNDPAQVMPQEGPQSLKARMVAKWSRRLRWSDPPTDSGRAWTRHTKLVSEQIAQRDVVSPHSADNGAFQRVPSEN